MNVCFNAFLRDDYGHCAKEILVGRLANKVFGYNNFVRCIVVVFYCTAYDYFDKFSLLFNSFV